MFTTKIYWTDEQEMETVKKLADEAGMSLNEYIKSFLPLPSKTNFETQLQRVIEKAASPNAPNEFTVPDLFTAAEWADICKKVNPGLIGKRFYERVYAGLVEGVQPVAKQKSRRAVYVKP